MAEKWTLGEGARKVVRVLWGLEETKGEVDIENERVYAAQMITTSATPSLVEAKKTRYTVVDATTSGARAHGGEGAIWMRMQDWRAVFCFTPAHKPLPQTIGPSSKPAWVQCCRRARSPLSSQAVLVIAFADGRSVVAA